MKTQQRDPALELRRELGLTPRAPEVCGEHLRAIRGVHGWLDRFFFPNQGNAFRLALGASLTLVVLGSAISSLGIALNRRVFSHPFWMQAAEISREALAPSNAEGWSALPFFYSLGAWPSKIAGHPVFYTFPYEQGPPRFFAGHLVAHWDGIDSSSGTTLTLEGPKTPKNPLTQSEYSREDIHNCLRQWIPLGCQPLREALLQRPVREIVAALGGHHSIQELSWTLQWRSWINSRVNTAEQTQGIYLSAQTHDRTEIRFIAISSTDQHQMLSYSGPTDLTSTQVAAPASTQTTFEQVIASLQLNTDLRQGRDWINERLARTHGALLELGTAAQAGRSARVLEQAQEIAEIEALLLSKISVEPSVFESYYHLAGTAFELLQLATQASDLSVSAEWRFSARSLLHSAIQYARDVAPSEPRLKELEKMENAANVESTGATVQDIPRPSAKN